MKWYVGGINLNNRISKQDTDTLFEGYYGVRPPQNTEEFFSERCTFIEIYNSVYPYAFPNNYDENVFVLGDIEIYNQDYMKKKYLDNLTNDAPSNILVDLYRTAGIGFLKDLSGEFSFVLYDCDKNIAYLVTDQVGSKPLFWQVRDNQLYFASDIFFFSHYIGNQLNHRYFKEFYYHNGHLNSDQTPYAGIFRIESGTCLSYDFGSKKTEKTKYWDLISFQEQILYQSEESYINEFLELLKQSVARRLLYNDKDAIMMSGGMDSTSLFAISKGLTNTKITPVCGVFDKLKECDERYYIQQILDMYGQEAINVLVDDCGMFCGYPENYITYEPYISSLVYRFSEEIIKCASKNGQENILTGYGGDHLLTGTLLNIIDKCKEGKFNEVYKDIRAYSYMTNRSFLESFKEYLVGPLLTRKSLPGIENNLFLIMKDKISRINSYNQKELYFQMNGTTARHYLTREIGPRYGISIKNPFLDKDLIEYVFRIPGDLRLNKKYPKYVLRQAMIGLLPEEVIDRVTKTVHVSLSYKGIVEKWPIIFPIVKEYRMESLNLLNITKNQWEKELIKFRSGQPVRDDIYILLAIELWIFDYYRKLKY